MQMDNKSDFQKRKAFWAKCREKRSKVRADANAAFEAGYQHGLDDLEEEEDDGTDAVAGAKALPGGGVAALPPTVSFAGLRGGGATTAAPPPACGASCPWAAGAPATATGAGPAATRGAPDRDGHDREQRPGM